MTKCLELIRMDLFVPSVVRSYRGNRYTLVIVDDYSRMYNSVNKNRPPREFDNEVQFGEFCNANGITHNFSAPRTPQSNGVVERKNRTLQEIKSPNVTFNENPPPSKTSPLVDDDLDEEEAIRETKKKNLENVVEDETLEIDEIVNIKESRNHPLENVIGNLNQRTLRSQAQNQSNFFCFISTIEPKNVNEALGYESWIVAMLVLKAYNQQEGIEYDETYAPVSRLESIRILLAYACALDFKLFQMDVKSAFPNSFINEEDTWNNLWDSLISRNRIMFIN
ncbi:retrovirus-related pol polyprotein from transposon TNT 1-94 [Tanacetum coccineum]